MTKLATLPTNTQTQLPQASIKRFVRLPDVLAGICMAERTLYDLMNRGEFPRPVKIGKMSMWVEEEVVQWQQARLAARSAEKPN